VDERIKRLEEKLVFLERHVGEQDRAMLELAEELATLRREVRRLREQRQEAAGGGAGENEPEAGERPPHY
jgi:SlyX protein